MIYNFKDLTKLRETLRDKKIVFVSGCFDIIHAGHIQFLEKAASYGDILIVGVLPDIYIHTHKKRPAVNNQRQRASIVHALKPVSHVILTPYREHKYPSLHILRALRPDVFFRAEKKHMYAPIQKELRELGIILGALPMRKIHSTTQIIKGIQKLPHTLPCK